MQGRINRAMYWLCVGVIAALYIASNLILERNVPISEIVLAFLCVPRLHDIGRSGWFVVLPLAIEIGAAVGAYSFLPIEIASAVMGLIVLVIAGLIVFLGCIPGEPAANPYGAAPSPGIKFERPKAR